MLELQNVEAAYGPMQALFGISFTAEAGKVTTLLGRNGMGKTTTVNSIIGLMQPTAGSIQYRGTPLAGKPAYEIAKLGIGLVPEGRQIFPNLSVRENLVATAANYSNNPDPWDLQRVVRFFPRLGERLQHMGNQLSGGEQQMLAIGRALMVNPTLLILDEATEGLAPLIRQEIWTCLDELKREGISILLIDKNLDEFIDLADQHYIVEKGHVVWQGDSTELGESPDLKTRYLGL